VVVEGGVPGSLRTVFNVRTLDTLENFGPDVCMAFFVCFVIFGFEFDDLVDSFRFRFGSSGHGSSVLRIVCRPNGESAEDVQSVR